MLSQSNMVMLQMIQVGDVVFDVLCRLDKEVGRTIMVKKSQDDRPNLNF
jgi:hypothetical protein